MKKRLLTGMVIIALLFTMSVPAFAADNLLIMPNPVDKKIDLTSFSDVPSTHWAYKDIMSMTSQGLFSGTTTPVNGVGTFAPAKTMTRAEFVTVVMRALYQEELNAMPKSEGQWWENSYQLALDKGILQSNELGKGAMDEGMSRQEMALVLVRATEKLGQLPSQLIDTSKIADYSSVGTYYRDSVVKAYSMGLLAGTDSKGTYAPLATMTRAQGATVLNRLVDSSTRVSVDFSTPTQVDQTQGAITITEYAKTERRLAKAGDTVVKADGTKIVLKVGPSGILGEGQGVAPDAGIQVRLKGVIAWTVEPNGNAIGHDAGKDSLGKSVMNQKYWVNEYTGEGHWQLEWQSFLKFPTSKGSFNYELSKDKNWVWLGDTQEWMSLPGQTLAKEGIQSINQANGIK